MSDSQNRDFADFASETDYWFEAAEDLRAAAEKLEPAIEAFRQLERARSEKREKAGRLIVPPYAPDPRHIYLMLTAYAIENLCKGLQVARTGARFWAEVTEKGFLPGWLLGHDVRKLLQKIDFPVSTDDGELADRLTRAGVWSARYPVPLAAKHWSVFARTVEGQEVWPLWHKEDDVAAVNDLYARVDAFVTEGWQAI